MTEEDREKKAIKELIEIKNIEELVKYLEGVEKKEAIKNFIFTNLVENNELELAKKLVERLAIIGPFDVNFTAADTGNTLLHLAITMQHSEFVEFLLQNVGIKLTTKNYVGDNILHVAARWEEFSVIAKLSSQQEMEVATLAEDRNEEGLLPINLITKLGEIDNLGASEFQILDIFLPNDIGFLVEDNLLTKLVELNNEEILKCLIIKYQENIFALKTSNGSNLMHLIALKASSHFLTMYNSLPEKYLNIPFEENEAGLIAAKEFLARAPICALQDESFFLPKQEEGKTSFIEQCLMQTGKNRGINNIPYFHYLVENENLIESNFNKAILKYFLDINYIDRNLGADHQIFPHLAANPNLAAQRFIFDYIKNYPVVGGRFRTRLGELSKCSKEQKQITDIFLSHLNWENLSLEILLTEAKEQGIGILNHSDYEKSSSEMLTKALPKIDQWNPHEGKIYHLISITQGDQIYLYSYDISSEMKDYLQSHSVGNKIKMGALIRYLYQGKDLPITGKNSASIGTAEEIIKNKNIEETQELFLSPNYQISEKLVTLEELVISAFKLGKTELAKFLLEGFALTKTDLNAQSHGSQLLSQDLVAQYRIDNTNYNLVLRIENGAKSILLEKQKEIEQINEQEFTIINPATQLVVNKDGIFCLGSFTYQVIFPEVRPSIVSKDNKKLIKKLDEVNEWSIRKAKSYSLAEKFINKAAKRTAQSSAFKVKIVNKSLLIDDEAVTLLKKAGKYTFFIEGKQYEVIFPQISLCQPHIDFTELFKISLEKDYLSNIEYFDQKFIKSSFSKETGEYLQNLRPKYLKEAIKQGAYNSFIYLFTQCKTGLNQGESLGLLNEILKTCHVQLLDYYLKKQKYDINKKLAGHSILAQLILNNEEQQNLSNKNFATMIKYIIDHGGKLTVGNNSIGDGIIYKIAGWNIHEMKDIIDRLLAEYPESIQKKLAEFAVRNLNISFCQSSDRFPADNELFLLLLYPEIFLKDGDDNREVYESSLTKFLQHKFIKAVDCHGQNIMHFLAKKADYFLDKEFIFELLKVRAVEIMPLLDHSDENGQLPLDLIPQDKYCQFVDQIIKYFYVTDQCNARMALYRFIRNDDNNVAYSKICDFKEDNKLIYQDVLYATYYNAINYFKKLIKLGAPIEENIEKVITQYVKSENEMQEKFNEQLTLAYIADDIVLSYREPTIDFFTRVPIKSLTPDDCNIIVARIDAILNINIINAQNDAEMSWARDNYSQLFELLNLREMDQESDDSLTSEKQQQEKKNLEEFDSIALDDQFKQEEKQSWLSTSSFLSLPNILSWQKADLEAEQSDNDTLWTTLSGFLPNLRRSESQEMQLEQAENTSNDLVDTEDIISLDIISFLSSPSCSESEEEQKSGEISNISLPESDRSDLSVNSTNSVEEEEWPYVNDPITTENTLNIVPNSEVRSLSSSVPNMISSVYQRCRSVITSSQAEAEQLAEEKSDRCEEIIVKFTEEDVEVVGTSSQEEDDIGGWELIPLTN